MYDIICRMCYCFSSIMFSLAKLQFFILIAKIIIDIFSLELCNGLISNHYPTQMSHSKVFTSFLTAEFFRIFTTSLSHSLNFSA